MHQTQIAAAAACLIPPPSLQNFCPDNPSFARNGRRLPPDALTRDARAACSGADATFENFYAIAEYFKASGTFDEAREALKQARKLVSTKKQVDKVADLLRSMK